MQKFPRESLSKILRDARRALGLTQEQAALKIGVRSATVARWEQDRATPTPANLLGACRAYGISLDDDRLSADPRILAARVAELEATMQALAAHVGFPLSGSPPTPSE